MVCITFVIFETYYENRSDIFPVTLILGSASGNSVHLLAEHNIISLSMSVPIYANLMLVILYNVFNT